MVAHNAFGVRGFTLIIIGPHGQEARAVPEGLAEVVVGRDPSCHLQLRDNAISRRHLSLLASPQGMFLQDTSANGTLVDGMLIKRNRVPILPHSVVRVGSFELRFAEPGLSEVPNVVYDSGHGFIDEHPTSDGSFQPPRARAESAPPPRVEVAEQEPVSSGEISSKKKAKASAQVRRKLHRSLVDHLDLLKLERSRLNPKLLRAKVELALKEIVDEHAHLIPRGCDTDGLIRELADEAVGLGPLEELLADDAVSEIMVVDPETIYIEKGGRMSLTETHFTDNESLRSTLERIVMPLGRRIDESAPMLDARLPDGSRVNAVIPPLATRGPCITIRKFSKKPLTIDNLLKFGSLDERMALFLQRSVRARKNIVVAGGTGSGKTTLLNILSASCSDEDRIVTIEDSAELQLQQNHVVTLEARPANMEGKGAVTIRDLVKNAMRMRPDRIIVGECRGGEALDMLLAMNTGHDGSMTTTHANSPAEALRRLESLALMSGVDLPNQAIREQIAYAVDLLVHQTRFSDGSRRVTSITEVAGLEDGYIETREIFGYRRRGTSKDGKVEGEFYATGYLPSYLTEFLAMGIIKEGEAYL